MNLEIEKQDAVSACKRIIFVSFDNLHDMLFTFKLRML